MNTPATDFMHKDSNQPHPERCRQILAAHPEVKQLMVRNPYTALIMLGVIALQTALAWWLGHLGMSYWWIALITAYCIGAFANHTMYVIIHEATHNLIFKSDLANKFCNVIADLPNLLPGSMAFRVYHIKHHVHMADYDMDGDMASHWEANLIGNSPIRKALWLMFFPLFQITRPPRLKAISMWSRWTVVNILFAVAYNTFIIWFCGWNGLLYLAFSFFFSIGLHPVGARWISEHYNVENDDQETYSYYGPLNIPAMNVGYHNEHHDFPAIPWNNLPKLRNMAPEFYNTMPYHTSWTKLLFAFIFDPRYTLHSRHIRTQSGKATSRKDQFVLNS